MNKGIDNTMITKVVCDTLSMIGISAQLKDEHFVDNNFKVSNSVLSMIAIIGDIKINMIYSMEMKTAESIIAIMMGASEYNMDTLGRSAIAELSNMISGSVCTALSADYATLDITTPTVLTGKTVSCIIHSVESKHVEFETKLGSIGIDLALESY